MGEKFGEIACPYLKPYIHYARFLDKQYGIRKDDDIFMIGDSKMSVVDTRDISIKGRYFKGTRALWGLLNRKNVTRDVVTADNLKR